MENTDFGIKVIGANALKRVNSLSLQQSFPRVYKSFFNKHNIVLSGVSVMTWGPDISHGVSVLRIKQKIPLKTYCGINTNSSGKVRFGKMYTCSMIENSFEENDLNVFFRHDIDKIIGFLEAFLAKHNYTGGLDIDFLFETPPGHGFAFSGSTSVLLAFMLYITIGKIDAGHIDGKEFDLGNELFDEIYRFSLDLTFYISGGKSRSGANNHVVMVGKEALPIIHLSKKLDEKEKKGAQEVEIDTLGNVVYPTIYKGPILEFLGKGNMKLEELPVDYGVIFTGLEYRFSEIESTREQIKTDHDSLNTFMSHILDSSIISKRDQDELLGRISSDQDERVNRDVDYMNFKLLEGFDSLLGNIHSENSADLFIDIMHQVGLSSFAYQRENRLNYALQYYFHKFRQFETERIAILPFNSGKAGGSLFFVMKKGKSYNTLQKVMDQLNADGHMTSLDYASWRDGYSSDGVLLEQYIGKKFYSNYTRPGDVFFTDSFGNSYCDDYEAIIEKENDCILLDTIRGRIYVKGTKLTSKDIHSQNTTIDMLRILLEDLGQEVSNTKLPVSTYSQNKNEILGKVVLPLKKIAKEYFGEEISLTCSGGITEYYLRLERDEAIRIGLIRTLQN